MVSRFVGAVSALAAMAASAHARDILFHTDGWDSRPIGSAIIGMGLRAQMTLDEGEFLDLLRAQEWDLVIVRRFQFYSPGVRVQVLAELQAHVDAGGPLMFSHAQLDEMPAFWPMLGIARARDLELPLSDIRSPYPIRHPCVEFGGMNVTDELSGPDFGDKLVPAAGASIVSEFVDSQNAAIVLSSNGRVLVNGQEWDNWFGLSAIEMAEDQIEWLLGCPADLDGDGDLTVFDFTEFQNRFDSGGAAGFADFDYDGRLDVFDFLEFFNLFDAGCE